MIVAKTKSIRNGIMQITQIIAGRDFDMAVAPCPQGYADDIGFI